MMKAVIRRTALVHWVAIAILLFATSAVAADSGNSAVELNEIASTFALELIKQGNVIADGKGAWTEHRP